VVIPHANFFINNVTFKFTNSQLVGAGLPLWLPNGATIRREIERYIVDKEVSMGYDIVAPLGNHNGKPAPTNWLFVNNSNSLPILR
jgi:hypothetical protein